MEWVIVLLFAGCFAGVAWYVVGGVKIKAGWQNGQSPLARYLDNKRREKFNQQLPEALATMSNALRAGFSSLWRLASWWMMLLTPFTNDSKRRSPLSRIIRSWIENIRIIGSRSETSSCFTW